MHDGELLKDALFNLLLKLSKLISDVAAYYCLDKSFSESRRQLRLHRLVIQNFSLNPRFLYRCELSTTCAVAECEHKSHNRGLGRISNNLRSDKHHGWVEDLRVTLKWEVAFFRERCNTHEHVRSRYPYVVKGSPAIVFALVAEFGAKISSLDAFHVFKCVDVTKLYDECIYTIILFFYDQSCKHDSMSWKSA